MRLLSINRDSLFLATLADLQQRVEEPKSEYELVKSAGLLRLLLLDPIPLLSLVGKAHDFKPRFRVTWPVLPDDIPEDGPAVWACLDGISPRWHHAPNPKVKVMRLDDFLALHVLWTRPQRNTVKDLIRQAAHIECGVHAGDPKSREDQFLADVADGLRLGGASPVVRSLRGIGAVVVDAAQPLAVRLGV